MSFSTVSFIDTLLVFVYVGKIQSLVLASIFAVALVVSDNGDPPSDPVFWCLSETSAEAFACYVSHFQISEFTHAHSHITEVAAAIEMC